jgi:serine/threonine protein kinase
MIENETVTGRQSAWNLIKKLGEGDAGEVYLAQSASAGRQQNWAILKRPRPSAFTGEMFRQSTQIRAEAKILKALSGAPSFDASLHVHTPTLLDESKVGAEYNGRNFIVIERARGLDLSFLARVAQVGLSDYAESVAAFDLEDRLLVDAISRSGRIPDRLLLAVLYRLARFIDFIHGTRSAEGGGQACGILWNDVKPDHLFWDAQRGVLTVIDWGNARFLEDGQATRDRKFSWADDYRQLFDEMGRYLALPACQGSGADRLRERLEWPAHFSAENSTPEAIRSLHTRLEAALQGENQNMAEARRSEETLLRADADQEISLADIQTIQSQVLEFGEAPDFERSLRYTAGFAARLAQADRLDDLRTLAAWAANLAGADPQQWRLVDLLARLLGGSEGPASGQRRLFLNAIQEAISRQWDNALWDITTAIQALPPGSAEPDWWPDLTTALRRLALGPEEGSLRPLVAVRRINLAVQAAARRLEEQLEIGGENSNGTAAALAQARQIIHCLKDEVIANWTQLDPSPPDGSLEYKAVEPVLAEAIELLPEQQRSSLQSSVAALSPPKLQASQVLAAWDGRSFLAARDGLRRLLVCDPDRRRILRADQAILSAPDFLARVQAGPQAEDNFPEWITSVELRGREMRNQVGGAAWLDALLDGCKQMRKGAWPSDLAFSRPELLRLMPWLAKFERRERLLVYEGLVEKAAGSADQSGQAPAVWAQAPAATIVHGVEEARLAEGGDLALIEPLDAWMPEARGSSARVISGLLQLPGGARQPAAVKLMRMDQVHYALPLFLEEVRILAQLGDLPGVAHLYECGFILLDPGGQFPFVSATAALPATGKVLRIGPDAAPEFAVRMDDLLAAGWTPYLAVEKQAQEDCLVLLCDAGLTRGQYQPMLTLLQMAVQICDILQTAHERNIVYRDHKLLHYYWQAASRGIYMIDWNVARYHPEGLTRTDLEMDIVQFGARGLHHILTGRTAPGALPLGPTRPEEIEQAARSYQTQWTYDDRRLSAGLRSILERVLAGEYASMAALRDDLKQTIMQLPDTHL